GAAIRGATPPAGRPGGGRRCGPRPGEHVDQPRGRHGQPVRQVQNLVPAAVAQGRAGGDDVAAARPHIDVRGDPAGRATNPYVGGCEVDVHPTGRGGDDQVLGDWPAVVVGEVLPPLPRVPVRVDVEVEDDQVVGRDGDEVVGVAL